MEEEEEKEEEEEEEEEEVVSISCLILSSFGVWVYKKVASVCVPLAWDMMYSAALFQAGDAAC